MTFDDPLALLLVPLILIWFFLTRKAKPGEGLLFPSGDLLGGFRESLKARAFRYLWVLQFLAAAGLALALARPQWTFQEVKSRQEGIDLILALDVSSSMLAEDFFLGGRRAGRIEAVREVTRAFIEERKNDRIGLVVFAAEAYPLCPLTLDHGWLLEHLARVEAGMIEDNTALGSGLSTSLNRLRGTPAREKVVVLVTDGRNNAGTIAPLTAAAAAGALKIKVHTIGAGSTGPAPYPARDLFGKTIYRTLPLDLDEELLKKIAARTGGRYFRATDTNALKEIFRELDRLEKSPFEEVIQKERREFFPAFLIPGLGLILLEFFLRKTWLRVVP